VFLAEGFKMFEEAPAEMIREVYVTEGALARLGETGKEFSTQCKEYGHSVGLNRTVYEQGGYCFGLDKLRKVGYEVVSDEVFAKMSDTKTPQGILLVLRQPCYSLEEILGVERPLLLIVEELQDPGNLGTIFRTGEGAGVSGILMSSGTADVFAPKVIRGTMGSVYRVPFVYSEDWERDVLKVKAAGVRIYAAHLQGKGTYWGREYQDGTAFLIGNEGKGLREQTAALADEWVRIPMDGQVESLNAAMAAGLLLYEAKRVRSTGKGRGI
jgi:TrmH family RNA methyltransferase